MIINEERGCHGASQGESINPKDRLYLDSLKGGVRSRDLRLRGPWGVPIVAGSLWAGMQGWARCQISNEGQPINRLAFCNKK
jgi:hypothetical protein